MPNGLRLLPIALVLALGLTACNQGRYVQEDVYDPASDVPMVEANELITEETATAILGGAAGTMTRIGVLGWNQLTDDDLLDVTPESILKDLDRLGDRLFAPYRYGSEAVKNWTAEE